MKEFLLELRSSFDVDSDKKTVQNVTKSFLDPRCLSHGDLRKQQYTSGYMSLFCHTDKLVQWNVDTLISDNTVTKIPEYIHATIPDSTFPKLKHDSENHFIQPKIAVGKYNKYGQFNKGAGVWEQWNHCREIIKDYRWLISFEPRQRLLNFSFIQSFLENPRNLFGWGTELKKDLYTGLFCIETDLVLSFIDDLSPTDMCNNSISLEKSLFDFILNSGKCFSFEKHDFNVENIKCFPNGKHGFNFGKVKPIEIIDKVGVIRYEAMHGVLEYH